MFKLIFSKIEVVKNLFDKPVVVVEIGNDWLKIMECNILSSGSRINKVSFTKLSQIRGPIPEAISQIFRDLKLNKKNVISYIPRQLVTVRIIELPSVDIQEITDMINLQIGKQTPYSKEEIIFSHRVISTEKEGYAKVMLTIAKNSVIGERLITLDKAGIGVSRVTFSSEGVYHWFDAVYLPLSGHKELKTVILVDIDSNYSDFIMISKGVLAFTKNILIGSNNFIDEQERSLERFIEELKRAINVYCEEEKNVRLDRIFLSGSGVARNISGMDTILSARLGIPCELIDTVKSIKAEENARALLNSDNFKFISVNALLGVVLKQNELLFSLMPNEMRIKKLVEEKKRYLTVLGILFISIFTMLSLLVLIRIYNNNSHLAQLKEKIAEIKDDSERIDKMRQLVGIIHDRIDARGDSLNMLNELYEFLPKEIYLTSINIERKKQLTIKGCAVAMSDVFKFVTALENSPYFKSVRSTYTTIKKQDNNEYADFEIVCFYE